MKKSVFICLLALLIAALPITALADSADYTAAVTYESIGNSQPNEAAPEIACKAAFIADPVSGKVIYEKNAHEKMYPASTTKILTALITLEKCELDETVTVSQNAVDTVPWDGSSAYMEAGEEFSVYVLLQALLIRSANEAANALAEHISGSVEEFAELCNSRAAELGCEDLHFVNPNGLHDKNHYCTAYDLFLIARECMKYDTFNEIVKTEYFTLPASEIYPNSDRMFRNTNKMLQQNSANYYYPYCVGMKTGNTTPAGRCLVARCVKDNLDLICIVLGGEINSEGLSERYLDAIALFDFAFNNYSYQLIDAQSTPKSTARIKKATRKTKELQLITGADIYAILPNSFDKSTIITEINIEENLTAPIEKNQPVGTITYSADGVNYTTELLAGNAVEKPPYAIYNGIVLIIILLLSAAAVLVLKHKKSKAKITSE